MNIKKGIVIAMSITSVVLFSIIKIQKIGPCSQELEEIVNRKE